MATIFRRAALPGSILTILLTSGVGHAADCSSDDFTDPSIPISCEIPLGVEEVTIAAIGGGGGGGSDRNALEGAGGGGGGAYCGAVFEVTPGQTLTGAVGAGGAGATSNGSGIGGAASSVSGADVSGLVATGGAGGAGDAGGAGGSTAACVPVDATGENAFPGGSGGSSNASNDTGGGGGGGGAGSAAAGSSGLGPTGITGRNGGAGGAGAAPGGSGGDGGGGALQAVTNGANGSIYGGGGGGGGYRLTGPGPGNGGNGANGLVRLTLGQAISYTITEDPQPQAGGSVNCDSTSVLSGGSTACTASPNSGFELESWSGVCAAEQTNVCTLDPVTGNTSATANFREQGPTPPTSSTAIPTMSAYGLLAMTGLLTLLGGWQQRRRRR